MMTLRIHPVSKVATALVLLVAAHAVQAQARFARPPDANAAVISTTDELTPEQVAKLVEEERAHAKEQLTRLREPVNLKYYRTRTRQFNPDLGAVLGIEPSLESRLIELLADQSIAEDVRSYEQRAGDGPSEVDAQNADRAAVAIFDRERGAIKQLLGAAAFGRYLDYLDTHNARLQVGSKLGNYPLTPDQKEKLIVLWAERERERIERTAVARTGLSLEDRAMLTSGDVEAQRRFYKLADMQRSEKGLEVDPELLDKLLKASATFLSSEQQSALAERERSRFEVQRRYALEVRRQAGLSPDQSLDAVAPRSSPEPQPVARPLRWAMRLSINQHVSGLLTFYSEGGQTRGFVTAQGLLVDALATPYDNGRMHVKVTLFEKDATGRHRIGDLDVSGPLNARVDGPSITAPVEPLTTSWGVIAGSKGYALAIATFGAVL